MKIDTTDYVDHQNAIQRSNTSTTQPNSWTLFGTCFTACQHTSDAPPPSYWESRVAAFNTQHSMASSDYGAAPELAALPAVVNARQRLSGYRHRIRSGSNSTTGTPFPSPQVVARAAVPVSQTLPTHLKMPVVDGGVQVDEQQYRQYVQGMEEDRSAVSAQTSRAYGSSSGELSQPGDDNNFQDEGRGSAAGDVSGDVAGGAANPERSMEPHTQLSISPRLSVPEHTFNNMDDLLLGLSSSSSTASTFAVEALNSVAGGVALSSHAPPDPSPSHALPDSPLRSNRGRARTVRFTSDVLMPSDNDEDGQKWELPAIVADEDLLAVRSLFSASSFLMLPSPGMALVHRSVRRPTYHSPYIPAYDMSIDSKMLLRMSTAEIVAAAKMRSAEIRPYRSGVDELGFITDREDDISVRTQMYAEAFEEKASKRELRWAAHLKRNPFLKKCNKLKVLVRKGVPNFFRQFVWSSCIGSKHLFEAQPRAYSRYKNEEIPEGVQNQIDLDIRRTFPQHVQFSACDESDTQSGPLRLSRVLHAVAACDSEVAYCQSMNFIAASLLLFMEEGLAFWTMMQILQTRIDGKGMSLSTYYTPNLIGLRRDMLVLRWLLKIKAPRCYAVLEDNQVELEWICSEWFLCLFASILPSQVCFRLWDVMMYEGDKLIFRMSLAIFKYHEVRIIELANDFEKLLFFLKSMARQIVDHNGLMKIALKGLGSFSRKTIIEYRSRALDHLEAEAAKRGR